MKHRNGFIHRYTPQLLLLPAVVLVLLICIYPISNVIQLSFQNYNLLKPTKNGFAGLANYAQILGKDKLFLHTLRISIKWSVTVVLCQFILGLLTAMVLNAKIRFGKVFRVILFSPWAVAGVMTAIMWSIMFNSNAGVVNDLLLKLGILDEGIAWMSRGNTAFAAACVAAIWRGIPFFAITILAALSGIPYELYESASVDGANGMKSFFYITIPQIKSTIITTTMLRFIWTFNDVDLIYSMTDGGPNNATLTLPVYIMRTSINNLNYGYGAALAVCLLLLLVVFTTVYMRLSSYNGPIDAKRKKRLALRK